MILVKGIKRLAEMIIVNKSLKRIYLENINIIEEIYVKRRFKRRKI